MQKRKLFITLAAIITISLIGLSAQCGIAGEAPAIELEVYDGPDYSESDDICYYRVEATATGFPDPEVTFEDDDNVNPLGSGRVEVGVEVGDSYTLTATVTNPSGTASASITLLWEYGEEDTTDADADDDADEDADEDAEADDDADADEDAEADAAVAVFAVADDDAEADDDADADDDDDGVEPTNDVFYTDPLQTGSIISGGLVDLGTVFVGHMGGWDLDAEGYVSFDISELAGKEIQSATLKMSASNIYSDTTGFGKLIISGVDFGSADLYSGVKDLLPFFITSFDENTANINYSGEALLNRIKSILNDGKTRLQIRLSYEHPNFYSGEISHGIAFGSGHPRVEVTYLD